MAFIARAHLPALKATASHYLAHIGMAAGAYA
jgi:hypothetical protein